MVGLTASALIGVMNPVLTKLIEILEKKYENLKDVQDKIAELQDELNSMKTSLEKVPESAEARPDVEEWMHQLRELSYDVEDCIEIYVHRLSHGDTCDGFFKKKISKLLTIKERYSIGHKIEKLVERVAEVSHRHNRYKDIPSTSGSEHLEIDPRLRAVFEESNRLVGIDSQRDTVAASLTDSHPQRVVVSIVGPGGLGKTTLANQVFQKIKSEFDCTAFVTVSRNPNVNEILSDVFLQVSRSNSGTTSESERNQERYLQLVSKIREYLQNKRYLVIIDDIWSKEAWKNIQCAFPGDENASRMFFRKKNASRIMTTTRIQGVADSCCRHDKGYVYPMKPLNSMDAKRLFYQRIFKPKDECPPELDKIADDILKKCDGLPLAIVNIASLLATKRHSKQEWERVWKTLGSESGQDNELEVVKRILFLSYYDLPHYLKLCLLDLSIFPEDHKISRLRLIRRWMAQGFIIGTQGECLEDTGERYINELINRNMIQPVDIDYSGIPRACRVHDIILDLIITLSTKENFVTITYDQKLTASTHKIRRLSIQGSCEEKKLWQATNRSLSHVRSLSVFGNAKKIPPLLKFEVLQVLDLEDCWEMEEGEIRYIGSLIHLRYLSIRNIRKIPTGIGNLQGLLTLDLRRSSWISELPKEIADLKQLMHLIMPYDVKLPKGIGKMEALEELSYFSIGRNSPELLLELRNLTKLKVLDIFWYSKSDVANEESTSRDLLSSLCKLGENELRSLYVRIVEGAFSPDLLVDSWSPPPRKLQIFRVETSHYYPCFSRLPELINSSSELTYLQIALERLELEDMEVLESLSSLLYLNLHTTESTLEPLTISCSGFKSLKEFHYSHISGGLGPMFEERAMPKIDTLGIRFSAHDKVTAGGVECDFGIRHLTSLKRLWVDIYCQGASTREVEAAEAAIRKVADLLPNRIIPKIDRWWEETMVDEDETEDRVVPLWRSGWVFFSRRACYYGISSLLICLWFAILMKRGDALTVTPVRIV